MTRYREINDNFTLEEGPLYKELQKLEPNTSASIIPLTWDHAFNFSVYDDRGNKWLDMTSGIFVANAGHANPLIKSAIQKQLDDNLLFAYNYPTTVKRDFITKLLSLSPSHFNKVALLNSGSEALDLVYKLVKFYGNSTGRKYIISMRGSYHGRGLSNDLICGNENKAQWSGVTDDSVIFIDFPYQKLDQFDPSLLPPPDQISAFFLETFQGWGAWFYPSRYISELYRFAKDNGILICFDEMQSGFYRLGPLYGYMTYGDLEPDIICLGKGITSSLPMAAVVSRAEIVDTNPKTDAFGTHSGSPLCCAAGLANLEFLSTTEQIQARQKTMKVFEKEASHLVDLPLIKQVNTKGMIAGVISYNAESATKIVVRCINQGVLPVCTLKNSIKLAPPLTITEEAISEAFAVIRQCVQDVANEIS